MPYRLHEIINSKRIHIVEGEKDADIVREKLEWAATTNPMGAGKWKESYSKYFKEKEIIIFPDNDDIGKKHAFEVAKSLLKVTDNIKIVSLPGLPEKEDISFWLEKMGNKNFRISKYLLMKLIQNTPQLRHEEVERFFDERKKLRPVLINLNNVEPRPVRWLWKNRIPLGKLTIIVGDPGEGKSYLAINIASHITTGEPWPDNEVPIVSGSVIILTAEDGLADTVRIRADASGANVEKIKILEGVINRDGGQEFFNLLKHLPALEQAITSTENARLVIIDPITAYLGNIDSHKNTDVRGALAPLARLAENYDVAIVAISHLNKNTALDAIYRTMGSIGFTAAARSVWAVSRDKNDETRTRRFFTPLKTNLSINPTSLAFRIIDNRVIFEDRAIEISPDDVFSNERREETSALGHAVIWLREALEDGHIPTSDLLRMARDNDISNATLRRAKERLEVESFKEGIGREGRWLWRLPRERET